LGLRGGDALRDHVARIGQEGGEHAGLKALAGACAEVIEWMLTSASVDDRLAGSYPFTTMMSVATAGWLMARQLAAAQAEGGNTPFLQSKIVACRYYLEVMVPEALSLKGSAMAGAALLYALDDQRMAV
jgi:hypothetical protein